jgi:hypothetical protein
MNIHPLWYCCIFSRMSMIFLLVKYAKHFDIWLRQHIVSSILGIMGLGFIYKYITGSNNERQFAKVFWHETRLLHGVLYLMAAYYNYILNTRMTSIVLALDITSSLIYRFFLNSNQ